jgi:hypothetical protein
LEDRREAFRAGIRIGVEIRGDRELRSECLARVARATEMRWLFTDGIYRAFVVGEGAASAEKDYAAVR